MNIQEKQNNIEEGDTKTRHTMSVYQPSLVLLVLAVVNQSYVVCIRLSMYNVGFFIQLLEMCL